MPDIILFTHETPGYYEISQIFDPDTNTDGMIIPRLNSMVLNADGILKRVIDVNSNTYKVTYGSIKTTLIMPEVGAEPEDGSLQTIVNYGNSRMYLMFDNRETPTKLTIDKKITIPGNDTDNYTIMKKDPLTGIYSPIALYYDINGIFQGNYIPLVEVNGSNNLKYCPSCKTGISIANDEVYYLIAYDHTGTETASFKLFAKQALINNVVNDDILITNFELNASQESDNKFYLYPGQDVNSLVISPNLIYNNGKEQSVAIDGNLCHIYGLEDFIPTFPGQQTTILVKYFLGENQQASGEFVGNSGGVRYLFATKVVEVLNPADSDFINKISIVPYYVSAQSKYILLCFLYEVGSLPLHVTSYVTIEGFNGQEFNLDQTINLSFNLKDIHPELENDRTIQQNVVLRLAPYAYYERYITRDSIGDDYGIYGVDSPVLARPVIYYDIALEQYFIPTSKFQNVNQLKEAFYYKARPIFDTDLSAVPVVPTHFTIRDINSGSVLLAAPVAIADYAQSWSILNANPAILLNKNCIVEFLKDNGGVFSYLYGAPVDVYQGEFNI